MPPQDDRFDLAKWWLNAAEFRGLKELAAHALTALTFPTPSLPDSIRHQREKDSDTSQQQNNIEKETTNKSHE